MTGSRRVESQCQSMRWLVCAVVGALAFAALPVLMVIYDGTCLGGALGADDCLLQRSWTFRESSTPGSGGLRSKIVSKNGFAPDQDDGRLRIRAGLNLKPDEKRDFFSTVFQDLMEMNLLEPADRALSIDLAGWHEVLAVKERGVADAVGFNLVDGASSIREHPFPDDTFDFVYLNVSDGKELPSSVVQEVERTLKPRGVAVLHLSPTSTGTQVSHVQSFVPLFKQSSIVHTRQLDGFNHIVAFRKHTVLKDPIFEMLREGHCVVTKERSSALRAAEPLIAVEPLKPWVTLKKNIQNIVYLSTVGTLGNYNRHIYIDMGARNYGSSIGSWFKNQYPKQGKTFEIFAIEADKSFQAGYANHSEVHFLPYAAWIRNESLTFGTNEHERGGMGRIQGSTAGAARSDLPISQQEDHHFTVQGFDVADWLQKITLPHDYVVLKMDVEGTEFQLLPHLFATGAICLIDELFLECHYNRWQRCCPERTGKFSKTFDDCLALVRALRQNGVFVHQWW